ncbi:hypothetical protein [Streptococcus sp. FDAARGOS_192]|uniref:hypothetical protein n=1 Tax=Streptococcus sp. FDAARGOS_192 TaxID=1839799 RepID=UPI00399F4DD6
MKALESDNRLADSAEQEILSNYVGWGGLANDFFDSKINRFAKERDELKSLVTKEEYRAMEMSSLTAYYTSPEIATAMWDKIVESGFKEVIFLIHQWVLVSSLKQCQRISRRILLFMELNLIPLQVLLLNTFIKMLLF